MLPSQGSQQFMRHAALQCCLAFISAAAVVSLGVTLCSKACSEKQLKGCIDHSLPYFVASGFRQRL